MTTHPVQLDLFDPPAALSAPTSAPARRKGTSPTRPRALRAADGAGTPESGASPARCPVVDRPGWCVRGDCRHWSSGCAHPEAARPRRRRRPA